ncbi:MAG: DNA cytosine methyltransferase [Halobacteriota archaeon]
MTRKKGLDLFCGLGGFSSAFEASSEWDVYTVDINPAFNPDLEAEVMDLRHSDLIDLCGGVPDVILASPPCTVFSTAANAAGFNDDHEPVTDRARDAVALVFHTVGLIKSVAPEYWFLENPRGLLRWPEFLGMPEGTVTYCQYGAPYMKPTDLWGKHPVRFKYKSCRRGAPCHESCGRDDDNSGVLSNAFRDPAKRALVPRGLSWSILDAVERGDAVDGSRSGQQSFGEFTPTHADAVTWG